MRERSKAPIEHFLAADEETHAAIQLYQSFGFLPSACEPEFNMIR